MTKYKVVLVNLYCVVACIKGRSVIFPALANLLEANTVSCNSRFSSGAVWIIPGSLDDLDTISVSPRSDGKKKLYF